jgi:hypothetical protein
MVYLVIRYRSYTGDLVDDGETSSDGLGDDVSHVVGFARSEVQDLEDEARRIVLSQLELANFAFYEIKNK